MTMPEGASGLESDAWMGEWVNRAKTPGAPASKSDLSNLADRTKATVETYYKAAVPVSNPWSTAQTALFSMFPTLKPLAEAIAGAGKSTLEHISTAITSMVNATGLAQTIVNLKAWAGVNLMLDPTFSNILLGRFPYTTGVASEYTIEKAHSGLTSWKWTQSAGTDCGLVFAPTLSNDDFAVKADEKYYLEAWIHAKSTNSTASGEIRLGVTFTDSSGTLAATDVYDGYALSSTAVAKGSWKKLSKNVTIPAGYDRAKFWLYASSSTAAGSVFYIDDVTVRESAANVAAAAAQYTANQGLRSPIDSSRLPMIPVSHIGDQNPNLLVGGGFDDAATMDTTGSFVWESEGRTKAGSAKVIADGTAKTLLSNSISVVAGQTLDIGGYLKWSGVTASGSAFQLSVVNYNSDVTGSIVDIASKSNPATSSSWTQLSGTYTVPSTGVDAIRIRLKVANTVTAGTILWDDISAAKQGILPGGLVRGADNGTLLQNVQDTWNEFVKGFSNIGGLLTDATGLDFSQTVSDTSDAIAKNALAITQLQTKATYNANSGIQEFVNFAEQSDSYTLGSKWAQIYSGSGTGTLGIKSGRAAWAYVNDASRTCFARYTTKKTLTDFQRIGVAFASAPSSDIFGNAAYNFIYGRSNNATTVNAQSYIYAKLGKSYCEIGCVVNGAQSIFQSKTSFSFKPNSVYWLECGETGGPNQIRLIDNTGNAILSFTDDANNGVGVSKRDENHRYAGLGASAFANGFGHYEPGSMLAFSLADNSPQPIVGSGFRRWRDSVTGVGATSGINLLDGSFFDTPEICTDEYEYTHSTNSVKVLKAGWYCVSLSLKLSDFLSYPFSNIALAPVLFRNGNVYAYGADSFGAGGGGNYRIAHTWIVYLNENEYVQPGYSATLDPVQNFVGEDSGAESYWQVSLLNWSLT